MNVYEIIDVANKMRPGNNFDNEIVEMWIAECDASIQTEVVGKDIDKIRLLKPDEWEKGATYVKGDRVSERLSGKIVVYEAKAKEIKESNVMPRNDSENWKVVPYDTYVGHPHDKLYYLYVIAMMDFATMEYNQYTNDRTMYEAAVEEFARWWQRKYSYRMRDGKGVDWYEADIRRA